MMKRRWIALALVLSLCLGAMLPAGRTEAAAKPKFDLTQFLKSAKEPVGSTLYVWGGGWNKKDNAAGTAALTVGVYKKWKTYFTKHRKGYSYRPGKAAWERGERKWRLYGLDCSGYVGWCVYNGVSENRRKSGYVFKSTNVSKKLKSLGYGKTKACTPNSKFKPGDIISLSGHVIIVLGQCSDGSVLLMHSTPNGGVQISGTYGAHGDQAAKLAKKYMKKYYPTWYAAFKSEKTWRKPESTYLKGTRFRFKSDANFTDSAGLRSKSGEQVLKYLY